MKFKELERFAFTAWSPTSCDGENTLMAAISAEEENDKLDVSTTSAGAVLELFRLDLKSTLSTMELVTTTKVDSKGTCLCWAASGSNSSLGLLIAGTASGSLSIVDPCDLLQFTEELGSLPESKQTILDGVHTGVVRNLDSNRFQTNLFASVADEAEVFIWDVNKLDQPMSPGTKTQPMEPINTVAWNPRVQHILSTAGASHCTIWDLRRSDPVFHLTKAMCQFEPHLMAWSPDVATRLCLADPTHPTADIQLWDLRYPKHMLALLARWPPSNDTGVLKHAALGNAGTINSLSWSPPINLNVAKVCPGAMLHDSDLIAVSLTASGALPMLNGVCGTDLQPTSAEFLVVWSVTEALTAVQSKSTFVNPTREPVFVGRLEDSDSEGSVPTTGLPNNCSTHWLPSHPGLVSVTHSDGWINVVNLNAGVDLLSAQSKRRLPGAPANRTSRTRHASHKVAEAFGDEVDLSSSSPPAQLSQRSNELAHLRAKTTAALYEHNATESEPLSVLQVSQPLPYLRLAPRWMKRRCGASFAFGGRLVSFSYNPESVIRSLPNSETAIGPSDSGTTTNSTECRHSVEIRWVETFDTGPIHGLSSEKQNCKDVMQDMIQWISGALYHHPNEVIGLCHRLGSICVPDTVLQGPTRIDPWEIFQVRLNATSDCYSTLSTCLGYNLQSVREQVDRVLHQPIELPKEFSCSCQSDELSTRAIEHLAIIKLALVTGDLVSGTRLLLHPILSALPHSGISSLAAFGIFLALHTGQNDEYAEIQKSLRNSLDCLSGSSRVDGTHLRAVALLLSALLQDDWTVVATQWPLDDWSTALAALVNHILPYNLQLFQKLCGVLIDRFLDTSSECSSASVELHTAAWIAAVLSGDLDGLIRAWCTMNSLTDGEQSGEQLLPLAIQLVVVSRSVPPEPDLVTSVSPVVSRIFSTVALWLGQTKAGRNEQDVVVALELLQRVTSDCLRDAADQNFNEIAHRLWCSLSDEHRQLRIAQFKRLFSCPYESLSSITQCSCGLVTPTVTSVPSQQSTRETPSSSTLEPQLPQSSLFAYPSQVPAPVPPRSSTVPQTSPSLLTTTHPAASYRGPHQMQPVVAVPNTPPIPCGIPTSWPNHPEPFPRQQTSTVESSYPVKEIRSPTMYHSTAPSITSLDPSGPPPIVSSIPPSSPPANVLQSNGTSWNDPPFLTKDYPLPSKPAVSVNHFYDPTQYADGPGTPARLMSTAPTISPAVGTSFGGSANVIIPGNVPHPFESVQTILPAQTATSLPTFPPSSVTNFVPSNLPGVHAQTGFNVATSCGGFIPSSISPSPSASVPSTFPPHLSHPMTSSTPYRPASIRQAPPESIYSPFPASNFAPLSQPGPPGQSGSVIAAAYGSTGVPVPPFNADMSHVIAPTTPAPPVVAPTSIPPQVPVFPPSFTPNFVSPAPPVPLVQSLPPTRRPPVFADERFGGEVGRVPKTSASYHGVAGHYTTEQWPAAMPLGGSQPSTTDAFHNSPLVHVSMSSTQADQPNPTEHSAPSVTTPIDPEFEGIENTLMKLVQLVRTVGGKPFLYKMDTVERRLATLFTAIRNPTQPMLSESVLNHLRRCVEATSQSDYAAALRHANLLIQSASGFESIHGFAPGLKILLQSARQLFPNETSESGAGWHQNGYQR